jgi:mRNA interferase RelE/StbE
VIHTIGIEPAAGRDLQRLDPVISRRVARKIDGLAKHPRAFGTEELAGDLAGFRKLRVGDYRVVYAIDDVRLVVTVWAVGHRSRIYETMRRRVQGVGG